MVVITYCEILTKMLIRKNTTPRGIKSTLIRRRGIYILPNLFTLGSLFAGFYSIVVAMEHHFLLAAWAIFIALILDGLDGRVARLINAQSAFGAELDSICDMVAFGVAPALVTLTFALPTIVAQGWQKFGWLAAFIYVACVALRLARFNIPLTEFKSKLAKRYFFGLPCPAAAAAMASTIWLAELYHLRGGIAMTILILVLLSVIAFLMVSNIKYRSFKDIDMKANVKFVVLIIMLFILVLIAFEPSHSLFFLIMIYVFSGPAVWLFNLCRGRGNIKSLRK